MKLSEILFVEFSENKFQQYRHRSLVAHRVVYVS